MRDHNLISRRRTVEHGGCGFHYTLQNPPMNTHPPQILVLVTISEYKNTLYTVSTYGHATGYRVQKVEPPTFECSRY